MKTVNHFKLGYWAGRYERVTDPSERLWEANFNPAWISCRFALRQTVSFYEKRGKKQNFCFLFEIAYAYMQRCFMPPFLENVSKIFSFCNTEGSPIITAATACAVC